ncbi:zinc carboxypeptidase family protein [Haematococcus lacustris]|uniref:Zinc carboxypeptidase family protein n=1 Tax=Haematococcus lacustris TaxID=44745 RepID=A0A699YIY3_HAELA|nr:zinc carboxypeptidase family protein [Haematococcus lacustris]
MAEFFMEGLLQRLTDRSDPVAHALLTGCVFYTIPNITAASHHRIPTPQLLPCSCWADLLAARWPLAEEVSQSASPTAGVLTPCLLDSSTRLHCPHRAP